MPISTFFRHPKNVVVGPIFGCGSNFWHYVVFYASYDDDFFSSVNFDVQTYFQIRRTYPFDAKNVFETLKKKIMVIGRVKLDITPKV